MTAEGGVMVYLRIKTVEQLEVEFSGNFRQEGIDTGTSNFTKEMEDLMPNNRIITVSGDRDDSWDYYWRMVEGSFYISSRMVDAKIYYTIDGELKETKNIKESDLDYFN